MLWREGLLGNAGILGGAGSELNLDALARHALENTAIQDGNLLDYYDPLEHYEPIRPMVVRRFVDSEGYRACLGLAGGTPREQFESEVEELDSRAYPPVDELPEYHQRFVGAASFLAAHWVMEAEVTHCREELLLRSFDLSREQLEHNAAELGWQREGVTNTRAVLEALTDNAWLKGLHCVHILRSAFRITWEEHGGRLPETATRPLVEIARFCGLTPTECAALCLTFVEERKSQCNESEDA
jgi:hypothetical protein